MSEIVIETATGEEIWEFDKDAWPKEDTEHFGKDVGQFWTLMNFGFRAIDGSNTVGTAKGQLEAGVIYLKTILVSREYREQGIGEMLIKKIIAWAMPYGAHKIFLFTMSHWGSTKFYEKLGFNQTGTLPNHYLKRDFVIYSKDLN